MADETRILYHDGLPRRATLVYQAGPSIDVTPVLDTSIYADNDVMFIPQEITDVFPAEGGSLALHSVMVVDGDDQNTDFDLVFFNASASLGTINGAVSISDADAAKIIGYVRMEAAPDSNDLINSRLFAKGSVGQTMKAASGSRSMWIGGIVRSGTPTYTASGMKIKLGFL